MNEFGRPSFAYTNLWYLQNVVVTGFFVLLFYYWWKKPHARFPSGHRGVPVVGSLPFIGKYPHETFRKWSVKYGPVFFARFGGDNVVIINTHDTLKQAFVNSASAFSGRPWFHLFHRLSHEGGIALKDYTESYRRQKQFGLQTLKRFGVGKGEMRPICEKEVNQFITFLKTKLNQPVNLKMDLYNVVANTISCLVIGKRFEYGGDVTFNRLFSEIRQMFGNNSTRDAVMMTALSLFEGLRFIPPFRKFDQRAMQNQIIVQELIGEIVEDHKNTFDPDNIRDFIDSFIYEQRNSDHKGDFTDEQLNFYIRDLFVAGTETTSTTLSWLILALLHHPEYATLLEEEVDKHMGKSGSPPSTMQDMPLTSAIIQEVFRYCTPVPLGVTHKTTHSASLEGHVIPANTKVVSNLWAINNDPTVWPNPEIFDPFRHIQDGKFIRSNKIIPFGIGPRFCFGESLAKIEVFVCFTKMLQAFRFKQTEGILPSLGRGVNFSVHCPHEFEVIISER